MPSELSEYAEEIIAGLSESMDEGMALAFCYLSEVLYARVYDGRGYVFPLPFMLTENADAEGACINIAAYTTREMIPFVITDVPRDELDFLLSVFLHVDAFAYADDEDTFLVTVKNECDMLDGVPSIELDGITLDELCDWDKEKYAELCRDRELNKYWGYDAGADNPDDDTDFYLDTVRREASLGVALTLAVREGGELVGEATVYGFDYRGSASIAVRVMKAYHGRGIGSRATNALIKLSRDIGLSSVNAEIFAENTASVKMTSKYMELVKEENGKVYFTLSL